jgi:acetoin utilization protein AcuA
MMEESSQKEIVYTTPSGDIRIRSLYRPDEIKALSFDKQFGSHAHYRSLYTKRTSLEEKAAQTEANVVLAVTDQEHIVGFGVLSRPRPEDRWSALDPPIMMEIKALEVARSWRSLGLADKIVRLLLAHPRAEDLVVYMVGYSWTWDLDGAGISAQQYRQMMIKLFEPYGFQEYETNEPNICLKPENLFMGRIGRNVSVELRNKFKWLRFGIEL